jgi:hypothetical protein
MNATFIDLYCMNAAFIQEKRHPGEDEGALP